MSERSSSSLSMRQVLTLLAPYFDHPAAWWRGEPRMSSSIHKREEGLPRRNARGRRRRLLHFRSWVDLGDEAEDVGVGCGGGISNLRHLRRPGTPASCMGCMRETLGPMSGCGGWEKGKEWAAWAEGCFLKILRASVKKIWDLLWKKFESFCENFESQASVRAWNF